MDVIKGKLWAILVLKSPLFHKKQPSKFVNYVSLNQLKFGYEIVPLRYNSTFAEERWLFLSA